jgi:4-hydroxy-tetrahydrodipicolinate reductase
MTIRVAIAGATGWAGSALARAVHAADDLELVGAVARSSAGRSLGDVLDLPGCDAPVRADVSEILALGVDVLVEYTKPESALGHALAALEQGAHVVIGTSGLTDEDYGQVGAAAEAAGRGALAVGNFALTVVLLQKFAEMAAKHVPSWEIVDYAGASKRDAPSGTARELAHRLGQVREAKLEVPLDETAGPVEARGARLAGSQVHSLRLPGFVIGAEVIFGMPDQRLVLRHEAGSSAEPYVDGALLAIRNVGSFAGLRRGLDSVMDFD